MSDDINTARAAFEPASGGIIDHRLAAQASQAISLKRIADTLETMLPPRAFDRLEEVIRDGIVQGYRQKPRF